MKIQPIDQPTAPERWGSGMAGTATAHLPYWQGPTGRLVHIVKHVRVIWEGARASWVRPRLGVSLVCRDLAPGRDGTEGMRAEIGKTERCRRCFRPEHVAERRLEVEPVFPSAAAKLLVGAPHGVLYRGQIVTIERYDQETGGVWVYAETGRDLVAPSTLEYGHYSPRGAWTEERSR